MIHRLIDWWLAWVVASALMVGVGWAYDDMRLVALWSAGFGTWLSLWLDGKGETDD